MIERVGGYRFNEINYPLAEIDMSGSDMVDAMRIINQYMIERPFFPRGTIEMSKETWDHLQENHPITTGLKDLEEICSRWFRFKYWIKTCGKKLKWKYRLRRGRLSGSEIDNGWRWYNP